MLYSSFNFSTEVGGQCHAPAALPPGKTRYPLYRRLGGHQGRSGWVRKISPSSGFDPWTFQPVASCYTVCTIPALDDKMLVTLLYFIVLYFIMQITHVFGQHISEINSTTQSFFFPQWHACPKCECVPFK